jgi:hypothetical protein
VRLVRFHRSHGRLGHAHGGAARRVVAAHWSAMATRCGASPRNRVATAVASTAASSCSSRG